MAISIDFWPTTQITVAIKSSVIFRPVAGGFWQPIAKYFLTNGMGSNRSKLQPLGIDREARAKELRFAGLMMSSLYGVGERDVGYIASDIL